MRLQIKEKCPRTPLEIDVDPLKSPKCKGAMKIISVIDQPEGIKAILQGQ
jgi:hypothetical protein